jgi:hypothetical protein
MGLYDVLLGVDRAARDTGRRITMQVRERDPLAAAIAAERMADRDLEEPALMYTHAMRVTPVSAAAAAMALAA